jgi:hypothetical protein
LQVSQGASVSSMEETYKIVLGIQRASGMSTRGRLICHSASSPRARRKEFWRIVVVCATRPGNFNIARPEGFAGAASGGGDRGGHVDRLRGLPESFSGYCPAAEKEWVDSMMMVLNACN